MGYLLNYTNIVDLLARIFQYRALKRLTHRLSAMLLHRHEVNIHALRLSHFTCSLFYIRERILYNELNKLIHKVQRVPAHAHLIFGHA